MLFSKNALNCRFSDNSGHKLGLSATGHGAVYPRAAAAAAVRLPPQSTGCLHSCQARGTAERNRLHHPVGECLCEHARGIRAVGVGIVQGNLAAAAGGTRRRSVAGRQSPSTCRPIPMRMQLADFGAEGVFAQVFPAPEYANIPRRAEVVHTLPAPRIGDPRATGIQGILLGAGARSADDAESHPAMAYYLLDLPRQQCYI